MTRPAKQAKPKKPKGSPLYAHGSGRWAKKVNGRTRYFGPWCDHDGALEEFKRQFPYLQLGIEPPLDSPSLASVLNSFDDAKRRSLEIGELSQRSYDEYVSVMEQIASLGKSRPFASLTADDLGTLRALLAKGKKGQPLSPVTHKRLLTYARSVFFHAQEELGLVVRYKKPLRSPPKHKIRERRAAAGERMFSAEELRALLAKANPHMSAVVYLGINAGLGPADCIQLTPDRIKGEFLDYIRSKTGVRRRCHLWPETRKAVEAILDGEHVFNGRVWTRHIIAGQFKSLCEDCGIYRKGITTPYSLRRTFETVAKCADVNQSVIDRIMGHERPDMSEIYNQRTFDKQLRKCTDFVHRWLNGLESL
jgi:integrase